MLTLDLFEDYNKEPEFIQALRDFLPVALKVLELKQLPKIKLKKELGTTNVPTFGRFTNEEKVVYCVITNRHPNDILRTLAHEMAHYAQGERDELDADSWHTGSPAENDANAQAGIVMREFNKKFPKYLSLKPIVFEEWSKKYKKSIDCSHPKGFSQKAHCAGRKKHTNEAEGQHCDAKNAVPELKAALTKRKTELKNADAKVAYDKIDKIMTRIAQTYKISGQKLHDLWTERYGEIPDTWVLDERKENKSVTIHTNPYYRGATIGAGVKEKLPVSKMPIGDLQMWESDKTLRTKKVRDWVKNTLIPKLQDKGQLSPMIVWNRKGKHFVIDGNHRFLAYRAAGFKGDVPVKVVPQEMVDINNKVLEPVDENFADGKGPGKPGDSQRHGIPKGATKAELEKASHSKGRKGQLARWQINMRNGKKK